MADRKSSTIQECNNCSGSIIMKSWVTWLHFLNGYMLEGRNSSLMHFHYMFKGSVN